jgi:hypothetical protein
MNRPADFDQTGCAWPSAPVDPADAPRQAGLFADDFSQPDAGASEPVFWAEPTDPDDQRHPAADRAPPIVPPTPPNRPTAGDVPADAPESA